LKIDKIQAEINRLKKLNHPRIIFKDGKIEIDSWCDGNETESNFVDTITRKLWNIAKLV